MQSKTTVGVRGGRFVVVRCEWCGTQREVAYEHRSRRFCPKPATCCYDYLKKPKREVSWQEREAVKTGRELLRRQRSSASRTGQKRTADQRARIRAGSVRGWEKVDRKSPTPSSTRSANVTRGLVKAYREGRIDPTGCYKGKWQVYRAPGRTVHMRSRSEALLAHILDSFGVEWEYEPQRFDLGWATYSPDFYLPEFDHWIEVKGFWTEVSRRKFDEFSVEHSASAVMARTLLRGPMPESIIEVLEGV